MRAATQWVKIAEKSFPLPCFICGIHGCLQVFDTPTILVGEERFYGIDRIAAAEKRLSEMETRRSASRPGWGILMVRNTGTNQAGDLVVSFISSVFVECREKERVV